LEWPERSDHAAVEALMTVEFLRTTNAIRVGPNGTGKSTLAKNIAHHAVIHGHPRPPFRPRPNCVVSLTRRSAG
jgi:hypothetical protein